MSYMHSSLHVQAYAFLPLQMSMFELQSCVGNYQTNTNAVANNPIQQCAKTKSATIFIAITSSLHSVSKTILTK